MNPTADVVDFPAAIAAVASLGMAIGRIAAVEADLLRVEIENDTHAVNCEVLVGLSGVRVEFQPGDRVLVAVPASSQGGARGVVLGRVAGYGAQQAPGRVLIAAQDQVAIQCGEASIDLRSDGKVLVRGDDVLVRAKGTQRIRAGTVSIN